MGFPVDFSGRGFCVLAGCGFSGCGCLFASVPGRWSALFCSSAGAGVIVSGSIRDRAGRRRCWRRVVSSSLSLCLSVSLAAAGAAVSVSVSVCLSACPGVAGAGLVLVSFVVCAAAVLLLLLCCRCCWWCCLFVLSSFSLVRPAGCLPGAAGPDACRACGPAADCRICFLWFHIVQCKEWLPPKIAKNAVFRRIGSHVINVSTEKRHAVRALKCK